MHLYMCVCICVPACGHVTRVDPLRKHTRRLCKCVSTTHTIRVCMIYTYMCAL